MTRSMSSKLARTAERRIPFELGRDEKGPCIGYCHYHRHPQIIGNGELVKCLDQKCNHIVIFRPEGSVPKEGMILQIFIVPNKEIYKTEENRKKAEEELRYVGEVALKRAVQEYVQSGLNVGHQNNYHVSVGSLYSQNQKDLGGCPLNNYPKQKKEKKERGGIKRLYKK